MSTTCPKKSSTAQDTKKYRYVCTVGGRPTRACHISPGSPLVVVVEATPRCRYLNTSEFWFIILQYVLYCTAATRLVAITIPSLVSRRYDLWLGDAVDGGVDENLAVHVVDIYAIRQPLQVCLRSR